MIDINDLAVNGSEYLISLTKLTGQRIADIHGYLSNEFGDAAFKLVHVVLESGEVIDVEGEHDFPYLSSYENFGVNLDMDTLNALYRQDR